MNQSTKKNHINPDDMLSLIHDIKTENHEQFAFNPNHKNIIESLSELSSEEKLLLIQALCNAQDIDPTQGHASANINIIADCVDVDIYDLFVPKI